jgi:hypothetical protein
MVVLGDYNFLGTSLQISLYRIDFGSFLMVVVRRIVLALFVVADTSSIMVIYILGSPVTLTRVFNYFP